MKNDMDLRTDNTEMVTISRAEYEALVAEKNELVQKLDWLMEQARLTKKVYGASSEQTREEVVGQLSFMFDEAEAWLSSRKDSSRKTKVAAHTRQKRSSRVEEILPENVPVEVVERRAPEKDRLCPECGTLMEEIGKEVRRTLVMDPAQAKIREDVYYRFTVQGTAASRVFFRIVAKAVRMGEHWSDVLVPGLTRPLGSVHIRGSMI